MSVYVDSSTSFILFHVYRFPLTEWIAVIGLLRVPLSALGWVQKQLLCGEMLLAPEFADVCFGSSTSN